MNKVLFTLIKKAYRIYQNMRKIIFRKYVEYTVAHHEGNILVGGYTQLTGKTYLKNNVSFNGMKIYGNGKVQIGRYFHSGVECMMVTSNHNFDHGTKIPYDSTNIDRDIFIEDFVWLGSRVTILGGVTIGEGAIIQAGALVVSNIPKYGIAGGSPAKVFKYRDIEHFERLKSKEAFHQ